MEKKKSQKPFYKKWWFIVVVALFVIGLIGAELDDGDEVKGEPKDEPTKVVTSAPVKAEVDVEADAAERQREIDELATEMKKAEEEEAAKKAAAKAKAKEELESMDPKSRIEKIVTDKLKNKTNTDKERIVSVEQLPEDDESLYFIVLLNANENLTNNLTRHSMLMDSKEILEPISKIKNMNKVVLQWQLPLIDSYGNTKDGLVMTINLERDALDKINWENFNVEKFPDVSKTYFEHPAIKK
ncbi:hypothetical protein [Sporosarcina sp. FSL K6-1508]|uniref:hypothetical protein n=1 Tax=Sporosarcina sp. FSL K6-1508 TaxID=2921553 RepID=UPI0030FC8C3C